MDIERVERAIRKGKNLKPLKSTAYIDCIERKKKGNYKI